MVIFLIPTSVDSFLPEWFEFTQRETGRDAQKAWIKQKMEEIFEMQDFLDGLDYETRTIEE